MVIRSVFIALIANLTLGSSGDSWASGTCDLAPTDTGVHHLIESVSDAMTIEERYRAFHDDYLSTGMCDPAFNYTGNRRLALLISAVKTPLASMCSWGKQADSRFFEELKVGLGLTASEAAETERELLNCSRAAVSGSTDAYYLASARLSASALKMILKKYRSAPETLPPFGASFIHKKMESLKMVRLTADGRPDCDSEFVSFDAFRKAMQGYEKLKKTGKPPANSRYLTVVDYTKPSNSRRLIVLDLTHHRVVNQTWVAHGDGVPEWSPAEQLRRARMTPPPTPFPSEKGGSDRFGSNPKTSNEHKSNLSSLGFIRAETEYNGVWGRSLRLHGLESGVNDQMLSRGVVLHGWGVNQMSWNPKDTFMKGVNEISSLGSLEGKGLIELNAMSGKMSTVAFTEVNNATKGCLGVSEEPVPVRQSDGTFRGEKNQRDLLIELLGGKSNGVQSPPSLIFNYGGANQTSAYFE